MCKDANAGTVSVFRYPDFEGFVDFANGVTRWIGHNVIGFDLKVLQRHFPGVIPELTADNVYDTLVVSRLLRFKQEGEHSLDSWGKRLGIAKGVFSDWSKLSEEMVDYCIQDVEVTAGLYEHQSKFRVAGQWQRAIRTEHTAAIICERMAATGFHFERAAAVTIERELTEVLEELDGRIRDGIPPRVRPLREITPRLTQHGTLNQGDFRFLGTGIKDLTPYSEGASFTLCEIVPFNPGSPKQMVEYLNAAGWKPTEKTDTHIEVLRQRPVDKLRLEHFKVYGWKVSETNLNTLPADAPDAAKLLARRLTLASRLSDVREWLALVADDSRIHGKFMSIGSWTHRMAHHKPNTGNIARPFQTDKPPTEVEKIKLAYDGRLRALWGVPKGHLQIGVDMDSAHLRVLAHLMDDKGFTDGLLHGDKSKGTDTHSRNQIALGHVCKSRDVAKTFIYSFINGCRATKAAAILECSVSDAKLALEKFVSYFPGLDRLLRTDIPRFASRGYFEGIDGRLVIYEQEHGMLSGILQNAEVILLKTFVPRAFEKARDEGHQIQLLNLVHDEVQIELMNDNYEEAARVGDIFRNELTLAAQEYNLRCPFTGGVSIGTNWAGAH